MKPLTFEECRKHRANLMEPEYDMLAYIQAQDPLAPPPKGLYNTVESILNLLQGLAFIERPPGRPPRITRAGRAALLWRHTSVTTNAKHYALLDGKIVRRHYRTRDLSRDAA